MPDSIKFSELNTAEDIGGGDIAALAVENQQAENGYASRKATLQQIGGFLNNGLEYTTGLNTDQKKVIPAINELLNRIISLYPVKSFSATPLATLPDSANNVPMKSLSVNIVPKETGTGTKSPSNPYTISGVSSVVVTRCGVNIWDEETELGSIDANGDLIPGTTTLRSKNLIKVNPNTSYYFLGAGSNGYIYGYDKNGAFSGWISGQINNNTFKTGATTYYLRFRMASDYGTTYLNNMGIMSDTSKTAYEPYSATTHTIALGQTIYGGVCDVTGGHGNETYGFVDLGNLDWTEISSGVQTRYFQAKLDGVLYDNTQLNYFCECYSPAPIGASGSNVGFYITNTEYIRIRDTDFATVTDFKTGMSGMKFVYPLATPTSLSTTPTTIKTMGGMESIFADCGDVSGEYRADIQAYIDGQRTPVE